MADNCIVCDLEVLDHHQAFGCDECDRWQHLSCFNQVFPNHFYQAVVDGTATFPWTCHLHHSVSSAPQLESTEVGDGDIDTTPLDISKVMEKEDDPLDVSLDLPDRAAARPLDLLERCLNN